MPTRFVAFLAGCSALAAIVVATSAPPASAHAFLVSTTPAAGARLERAPTELVLRFSELVERPPTVSVRRGDGTVLDTPSAQFGVSAAEARVALPRIGSGVYVAAWRVLSSDGHESAGEWAFGVGDVGSIPQPQAREETPIAESIATALFLVGIAIALGGIASERLVWPDAIRAPVGIALAVALIGAVTRLVLLASDDTSALQRRAGLLLLVAASAVAYSAWLIVRRLRLLAIVSLAGAGAAAAYEGHSGVNPSWWAAPANLAHLLLAGVWLGALAHLVRVLWHMRRTGEATGARSAAHRYARLALATVAPLLALGVAIALAEIDLRDLTTTAYGRTLLVKLSLATAALTLAVVARLRALRNRPTVLLRRLTTLELSVLVAVVAVSGVLANTTPPVPRGAAADVLGPAPLRGEVLRVAERVGYVSILVATTERELRVELLVPGDEPPIGATLTVDGRRPDGTTFSLYPRACGPGCFTMSVAWNDGATSLDLAARVPNWTGGRTGVVVHWPPAAQEPALLTKLVEAMRSVPSIVLHEQVTSDGRAPGPADKFALSGSEFMVRELYAEGGATGVRPLPDDDGLHTLVLYIPGSTMWQQLWYDDALHLRRQLIVNAGHRISRTFEYPSTP